MNSNNLLKNDGAVVISVGFILMFAVTVLVFSALVISFYTLSQRTEKTAMEESFKIIGSGLAIKMTTVDMLINVINHYGGTANTLEYEFSLPASIAGKSYNVNITDTTYEIIIEADNGAKIVVPFNMSTNITPGELYSGADDYRLYYNISANNISMDDK